MNRGHGFFRYKVISEKLVGTALAEILAIPRISTITPSRKGRAGNSLIEESHACKLWMTIRSPQILIGIDLLCFIKLLHLPMSWLGVTQVTNMAGISQGERRGCRAAFSARLEALRSTEKGSQSFVMFGFNMLFSGRTVVTGTARERSRDLS